jgi:hypothetical protein
MTKMTPTVDYPENTFETPHHRNLKKLCFIPYLFEMISTGKGEDYSRHSM